MTTENSDKIIELRSVSYAIGGSAVLEEIGFGVRRGEVLVLLGESGCGKTTTLRLVNRLIEPTAGEIFIDGRDSREWDAIELRRHIGYVLQDGGLFPHLTVAENVAVVPRLLEWERARVEARVDEMLALAGLEPGAFRERFPHELSGGQRQRVGVARALAADPPIVLLDEPFGALDALTRTRLQSEFAEIVRRLDKTAILVTHDLHEAMKLASRIALMDAGRIALLDTPEGFLRSELPLARRYLDTVFVTP
ncbi:MAG: ATP-binding cassette domain-containing protein [Pyrinomonadaceae bacterium]